MKMTFATIAKGVMLLFALLHGYKMTQAFMRSRPLMGQPSFIKRLKHLPYLSILVTIRLFTSTLRVREFSTFGRRASLSAGIDETQVDDVEEFRSMLHTLRNFGPRYTASDSHENYVEWIETQIRQLPSVTVESHSTPILKWEPKNTKGLGETARLAVTSKDGPIDVSLSGAVPYSQATKSPESQLVYIPRDESLANRILHGQIVLRDFYSGPIPFAKAMFPAYSTTADLEEDLLNRFDRPGAADQPLFHDLIHAGRSGAAGIIFMFDFEQEQISGYFEPHKGTHFELPAGYVGVNKAVFLKTLADEGATASLSIEAETSQGNMRTLRAVLPGKTDERVIYVTHTDGNTCVQENGSLALIALARYFSKQPLSTRQRTVEFVFNTGHLHISREGSFEQLLDKTFDDAKTTLIIPVEHLGTREIEATPRADGNPGRYLRFTGRHEVMFWCVGPSPLIVKAVQQAVKRRNLSRVIVTRGTSAPRFRASPMFTSFGGIGTYYHNLLLPTTSLISGPWSLWAPSFGEHAIDVGRFRQQTLALGDVYQALDQVPRCDMHIPYMQQRKERKKPMLLEFPSEKASDCEIVVGNPVRY